MESSLKLLKLAAFGAGVVAAVIALSGWRIDRGRPPATTQVRVTAEGRGGLAIARHATVLEREIVPGRHAAAAVRVRNRGSSAVDVHVRALAPAGAAADTVRLALRAGRTRLYRGTVTGLANWTVTSARLPAGERARIAVSAWIPATAAAGLDGQSVPVTLQFDAGHTGEGDPR